jgi:hypothetical protein
LINVLFYPRASAAVFVLIRVPFSYPELLMPTIVTDTIALYITLAMPAALLIAAAVLARVTRSQH